MKLTDEEAAKLFSLVAVAYNSKELTSYDAYELVSTIGRNMQQRPAYLYNPEERHFELGAL